jgi:hypothetical protein
MGWVWMAVEVFVAPQTWAGRIVWERGIGPKRRDFERGVFGFL